MKVAAALMHLHVLMPAGRLSFPNTSLATSDNVVPALCFKAVLSDLWRWRRRGGRDDDVRPHQAALEQLHNVQPPDDVDKMSSVLVSGLVL